jgi:hypothetical protein
MAIIPGILASSQQASTGAFWNLATVTGAGNPSSLTFSSIPSGYKSLHIRGIAKDASGGSTISGYINITFNGDTSTSNYAFGYLAGDANLTTSAAHNGTGLNGYIGAYGAKAGQSTTSSTAYGAMLLDIIDYTSTSKYKTAKMLSGFAEASSTVGKISAGSGVWQSTAAITSITLTTTNTFATNTTYTLYGVK